MNDKELSGRKRFKEALEQYDMEFFDEFPATEEEIYYSKKHRKKMAQLLKRAQNPFWKYVSRVGRSVAMVAIVVLALVGASLTSGAVDEFRSEFYESSTVGRPDIVWYRFPLEDSMRAPRKIETEYVLSYIPDGFSLVDATVYEGERCFYYENDEGETLFYAQQTLSHGVGFDTTHYQIEILPIKDIKVVYADSDTFKFLFWGHYGYSFNLKVPSSFTKEECLKLYESIVKVRE